MSGEAINRGRKKAQEGNKEYAGAGGEQGLVIDCGGEKMIE